MNGSQWLPWTVSKLSHKHWHGFWCFIRVGKWPYTVHGCHYKVVDSGWFQSIMAHDNRWPDPTTVSGDIRSLRVSERLKSSNRVSTSSCLNCNVLESVHTFLVYYLPDCMTEREIHQTARMLWPRPTHHQSVRYRAGDTCSARSNIWANTARQTDPQPCTSAFVKMITHTQIHTYTALKEICPSLLGSVCSRKCQYFHNLYPCLHSPCPKVFCQRSQCISNWTDMIFFFPKLHKLYLNIRGEKPVLRRGDAVRR